MAEMRAAGPRVGVFALALAADRPRRREIGLAAMSAPMQGPDRAAHIHTVFAGIETQKLRLLTSARRPNIQGAERPARRGFA